MDKLKNKEKVFFPLLLIFIILSIYLPEIIRWYISSTHFENKTTKFIISYIVYMFWILLPIFLLFFNQDSRKNKFYKVIIASLLFVLLILIYDLLSWMLNTGNNVKDKVIEIEEYAKNNNIPKSRWDMRILQNPIAWSNLCEDARPSVVRGLEIDKDYWWNKKKLLISNLNNFPRDDFSASSEIFLIIGEYYCGGESKEKTIEKLNQILKEQPNEKVFLQTQNSIYIY